MSESFYDVLGIDRTADERAIKKAYFARVRRHPPETHPEEFQRIREAYEVLSNPQSRADYDAVNRYDQYGAATAARLQAATAAMDIADWSHAQVELIAVLEQEPQLHFARDLLGMAYLNAHRPADAMREFVRLVDEQPHNAVYHLHMGYAHYAQNQYAPALECYHRARNLDANDARVLVATADCLVAQKAYEPALEELDRAIHLDGAVDFQDFVFFMRKVQIQLLRDRSDLADHELDQIFQILPDDAETRRYVATRLASLASDLFAMKRSADANRLLARCRTLDPSRKSMEYTFPPKTRLRIDALPEASRRWLARQAREPAPGKLVHNARALPVLYLISAIVFQFFVWNMSFRSTRMWNDTERGLALLGLVAAPIALAWALGRVLRVWRSPYGKYTTVHPCHLLEVDVDHVTVWPLVNLHDVSLSHHSSNGVYQYTLCRLSFAGASCAVMVRGQQASVDWANRVLEQRRKVLDLMGVGLLEAEEGFDLVPPSLLQPGKAGPPAPPDRARRRGYAVAAAAGALSFAVALPLNRAAGERHAWAAATRLGAPSAYRDYVSAFPDGAHAAAARAAVAAAYDRAIASYGAGSGAGAPGGAAALALLRALARSDGGAVRVRYEAAVDFAGAPPTGVIDPAPAFTPAQNRLRERALTSALRESFARLVGDDVLDLDDGGSYSYDEVNGRPRVRRASPLGFVIRYRVGPAGGVYESPSLRQRNILRVRFDWELTIDDGGGPLYRTRLTTQPESDIRYRSFGYENDILPYSKMADSAFYEFAQKVARDFGAADATLSE
jgi:tetratricopeptide (TPR) repeat protein